MAPPFLAAARLLPGNVLFLNPNFAGNSPPLSVNPTGASYTVNGGASRTLIDPVWSGSLTGWWYGLDSAKVMHIVDDSNGGTTPPNAYWVPTGTWTRHVSSSEPFGRSGGDGNNCGRGGDFRTSTTGTCTWYWPNPDAPAPLVPGRYRISVDLWDLVGPNRTVGALYTVRSGTSGAGPTLATKTWNMQTTLYPGYDRVFDSMGWHDLFEFDLPAGQSAITVTLSNPPGTGLLVADAMFLQSVSVPVATGSDTVVVSLAPNTFTVGGVPNNALTFTAQIVSDTQFWPQPPALASRTCKVGYNMYAQRVDWMSIGLADRSMGDDVWAGAGVTHDVHHEMTANPGTAVRLLIYENGTTYDERGFQNLSDGLVRLEFDVSGATFNTTAQNACTLTSQAGRYVIGAAGTADKVWTNLGGNRWRLEQRITSPTWQPITARSVSFTPRWTYLLSFSVPVNNLILRNFKWYDPKTPSSWTMTVHPVDYARMHGTVKVLRSMKMFGSEAGQIGEIGDFLDVTDRANPTSGSAGYRLDTVDVTAVQPCTFNNADHFDRYFAASIGTNNTAAAWFVATVPLGTNTITPGNTVHWEGPSSLPGNKPGGPAGSNWPINVGAGIYQVYPIDSTHVLIHTVNGNTSFYDPATGLATVALVQPVTAQLTTGKSNTMAIVTFCEMCKDLEVEPWINVPPRASDACIDAMADLVIAHTPDGRLVWVEYCNEIWNSGAYPSNAQYFISQACYANWQAAGSIPNTDGIGWAARRATQCHDRFRAKFTAAGRDPTLVRRIIGTQTLDTAYTRAATNQMMHDGKTFDALAVEAYEDNYPTGGAFSTTGSLPAIFKRLSVDGYLDVQGIAMFQGNRQGIMQSHRDVLNESANAHQFDNVMMVGYETGYAYMVGPGYNQPGYETTPVPDMGKWIQAEMMASPRMYQMTLSHLAYMQICDIHVDVRFLLVDTYKVGTYEAWFDLAAAYALPGTGAPGENANPGFAPTHLCQQIGGRQAWSLGTTGSTNPYSPAALYGATDVMLWQSYNGSTMPVNLEGNTFPLAYAGTITMTVNTDEAVDGNSVRMQFTAGGFQAQFNPYDGTIRDFNRVYASDPDNWLFNTYDRWTFWVKRPPTAKPLEEPGHTNTNVGVYVKQVTGADGGSDEAGGNHYYFGLNLPNIGRWTQIILYMHPEHRRGDAGFVDPGFVPYPTTPAGGNGGTDPPATYNFFDTLTRWYYEENDPNFATYQLDEIWFYREPHAENVDLVYSVTGTYDPATNRIIVTWSRIKGDDATDHEVRYAFSNIHDLGWAGATAAATVDPPADADYNGMVYDSTSLPLAGHSVVFIAIRPVGSTLFSQIAIPLTDFTGTPTPTPTPTALTVTGPGAITVGAAASFTATLNAAAGTGGVSFAPSVTVFSATFSPNPVPIPPGATSASFSVTATTAGTGLIGGTAAGLTVTPRSVTATTTPTPTPTAGGLVLRGGGGNLVLRV